MASREAVISTVVLFFTAERLIRKLLEEREKMK